jgi:hypothetical protein
MHNKRYISRFAKTNYNLERREYILAIATCEERWLIDLMGFKDHAE